ncbi:MAG TPA: HAMP domain-containing sensor histidine kinase [Longimicrobiales bacterium]|nr:HAMP domain-containing sensor histidine kinase [Longimicrobiales bacterium]
MTPRPLRTGGIPLTWRVAGLAGLAIAVLAVVAILAAYLVVRSSLYADLRSALRSDAAAVAQLYREGGQGSARSRVTGPTGGVIVQVYDPGGNLLVASKPEFERPQAAIPPSDVASADSGSLMWSGMLAGRQMEAALAPFNVGVVAVLADPRYIGLALTGLSRALLATAVGVVVLSLVVGYLVAGAALRPITRLSRLAGELGPERLQPIPYDGPGDEVGRLTESLNGLLARLRHAMDAQRAFLAETSHELRTPLTSLQGFLERAIRHADERSRRDLEDARRVSRSMNRLVEDLLQLSRGELVQEVSPHLIDVCQDVLMPVAEEFPGVRRLGESGVLVLGDPERLKQLVRNLVANAVRASGGGEGVALALATEDRSVILRVEDDGPGIPADVLPHIFEKFYKGAGGGAGLGLAIARQIARHHGGDIEATSRPRRTVFSVTLPAVEVGDEDE